MKYLLTLILLSTLQVNGQKPKTDTLKCQWALINGRAFLTWDTLQTSNIVAVYDCVIVKKYDQYVVTASPFDGGGMYYENRNVRYYLNGRMVYVFGFQEKERRYDKQGGR